MSKSFWLAAGIFACIVGVELMLIDSAVIAPLRGGQPQNFAAPDWAPWALVSAGAATILHFCRIPVRDLQSHDPPFRGH